MRFLQVLPNPYRTLDADGNPTHAFPCSIKHAGNMPMYVGAKYKLVPSGDPSTLGVNAGKVAFAINTGRPKERVRAAYEFSFEPVDVPDEEHYRRGIRSGDIIAANEATARRSGVPFRNHAEVLAGERKAAADQFKRERGALPAWAATETAKASN
jgi:hypothetical protein